MNARTSWVAGTLLATVVAPWAAWAADTPARDEAPVLVAQASSMPAAATPGCPGDAGLTRLEQRLLTRFDQSPQQMLGYVWITRNIYLLDRAETLQWAMDYRQKHPAC